LGGGAGSYGLLCAEATLISAADVEVHAVPTAMCRADSVMESLALHDGGVVCVSSAAALLRVIHNLRPPQ
jgi:hypothetical protein